MAAIDVLLPVRNGMPFLDDAIGSIKAQTVRDWRLLVLDHGSVDGSLELARHHAETDRRISVFSCPQAENLAVLRNIGLEKCDARFVMLQDADDISLPNRMAATRRAFADTPGLLAVSGEAIVIDQDGRRVDHLRMPASPAAVAVSSFFYFPMLHPAITADLAALWRFKAAYGKDILNVVPAGQSLAIDNLAEDYILFAQLALLGRCANLGVPLIHYRRHPKSVGIVNPMAQIESALKISRFLADSFCLMNGLYPFDPGPFCNHADYVFDFRRRTYSDEFSHMADVLRRGLGKSAALERELAFRRVLAVRRPGEMALRFLRFQASHATAPRERRTVRNWLLKDLRQGKYVYRSAEPSLNRLRVTV